MDEEDQDSIYDNVDLDSPDGVFQVAARMSTWGGREDARTGQDSGDTASGLKTYDPDTDTEPVTSGIAIDPKWMKKNGGVLNYGDQVRIINPTNGAEKLVPIIDAGPARWTGRGWDVRPDDAKELGLNTDDQMIVDFKPAIMGRQPHVDNDLTTPEGARAAVDQQAAIPGSRMAQAGRSAGTRSDAGGEQQNPLAGVRRLPDGGYDLGDNVTAYPNGTFHIRAGNRITEWQQDSDGSWKQHTFGVQPKSNIYRDPTSGISYDISGGIQNAKPLDLPGDPSSVDVSKIKQGDWDSVPEELRATAKSIAEYRAPVITGIALRSPYYQQMFKIINKVDPTFDYMQYKKRQGDLQAFSGQGKFGQNMLSFKTALRHAQDTFESSEALAKVYDSDQVSNFFNLKAKGIGGKMNELNELEAAADIYVNEVSRAASGVAPTEGERGRIASRIVGGFGHIPSASQRKTAIAKQAKMLGGRLGEMHDTYVNSFGKEPNFSFLSPESEQTLRNLGLKDIADRYGTKGGKRPWFDPETESAQFTPEPVAKPGTPDELTEVMDAEGNKFGLTPDGKLIPVR